MLITPYEAATQANVHKQTIYDQIARKPATAYFVHSNDKVYVDDGNPLWKAYCDKIKLKRKKGILQGKARPVDPVEHYEKMAVAVATVLNRELDVTRERLIEILNKIDKEYGGRRGNS